MSGLIKADAALERTSVRAVEWRSEPGEPTPAARRPEIVALEAELAALKQGLADAEARRQEALLAARAEAAEEATAAYRRDDAAALATLESALEEATRSLNTRIDSMETLALLLCETALAKIFGDTNDYTDLVARALQLQLAGLRREAVIAASVSAEDFPDAASLVALEARLGANNLSLRRDHQLGKGACRLDLRLGHIELSIPDHWQELQALLRQLADREAL